jgi:ZIP family zinc transporter
VNVIMMGFLGSLAAGLMTAAGALPVLFGRTISQRLNDALLGFAAGVMLAASFFSLIIPSLEAAAGLYGQGLVPALIAVGGVVLGVIAVAALNELIPHEHFVAGREGPDAVSLKKIWLFAFAVACLTGLVEPIAGLFGAAAVSIAEPVLPWGLAFAAGAMI